MYYKQPTPSQAVEITPAKKKSPTSLNRRFRVHPDGTTSPVEDILDWDFDKPNRAGE